MSTSDELLDLLRGGDRRSIGRSEEAVRRVLDEPECFEQLIMGMLAPDPLVRMRAADAAEKVTVLRPEFLQPYKALLLQEAAAIPQQEVRWHVAQMIPRLQLEPGERREALAVLQGYLGDRSKIVVTFSMQAMADLALQDPDLLPEVIPLLEHLTETGSPAMRSRGKMLLHLLENAK